MLLCLGGYHPGYPPIQTWLGGTLGTLPTIQTWDGVPPTRIWDRVPSPRPGMGYRAPPPPASCGLTNKLKTVPSPILRMRAVTKLARFLHFIEGVISETHEVCHLSEHMLCLRRVIQNTHIRRRTPPFSLTKMFLEGFALLTEDPFVKFHETCTVLYNGLFTLAYSGTGTGTGTGNSTIGKNGVLVLLHISIQPIFSRPGSGVLETDSVNRP